MQTLGDRKEKQLLVGFAAETENVIENGLSKLKRKNLDFIIVNDVTDPDGGFGNETNVVTLLSKNGTNNPYPAMSKKDLATLLLTAIIEEERIGSTYDR